MAWTRADLRRWLSSSTSSRPTRFVFVTLALHANGDDVAWPSIDTLAAETGYGTTAVRRALRELERSGDVVAHHREGLSTTYAVVHNPNTLDQRPQHSTPHTPTPDAANPNTLRRIEGIEGIKKGTAASFSIVDRGAAAPAPRGGGAPSPVITDDDGATFAPGSGLLRPANGKPRYCGACASGWLYTADNEVTRCPTCN